MLEQYFVRPDTVDRVRESWLGEPIEKYADWLSEQGYLTKTVASRVPLLIRFGEFAWERGAREWVGLPAHLDAFIEHQTHARAETLTAERRRCYQNELRGPIEQMLRLLVPGFVGRGRGRKSDPFHDRAAGFFRYLYEERGLREATVTQYRHELRAFEAYLDRIQLQSLQELSPTVLSAYVIDRSPRLSRSSIIGFCCALRVFLRYLHRQGFVPEDLSRTVETPRAYRLSSIPRSISWGEVGRMLEAVDRRSAVGRRDYAILLLLVTYGLRAREVAALTLDDIEWRQERLRVPERKAGHSTAYPLSPIVGQAILQYLRQGRPQSSDRHLFLTVVAPTRPMTHHAVSLRATYYLRKAGVSVDRPGSHTLRHTCVQRLVDAAFSLKVIGDYVGHRSPSSTQIYTKIDLDALREVACGAGEEIL